MKKILVILLLLFFSNSLLAFEFHLKPFFSLKEEYNDNVTFAPYATLSDYATYFSPEVIADFKEEKINANLSLRWDVQKFLRLYEFNTTDYFYNISGNYSLTQRLNFDIWASYRKTSTPDRELEITGIILRRWESRYKDYTLGINYLISERFLGRIEYSKYRSLYEDPTISDGRIRSVSAILNYQWTERDIIFSLIGYQLYEYSGIDIDNYHGLVGIEHKFSPNFSISLAGGIRYTEGEYRIYKYKPAIIEDEFGNFIFAYILKKEKETSSRTGGLFEFKLNKIFETARVSLNISRSVVGSGGVGGTLELDKINLRFFKKISEKLDFSISGNYYKSETKGKKLYLSRRDTRYYGIGYRICYKISKKISVIFYFRHGRHKDNITDEISRQNKCFLEFRFSLPRLM